MNNLKNVNLLTKAQYDALASHSENELWAVESRVVMESSLSTAMPSWYKVWSDGWIEQGGITSRAETVTFVKSFTNSNYTVATSGSVSTSSKTPSGMTLTGATSWYTCGY